MLDDKAAFIGMATSYQVAMGYRASWVYVAYKKMYGVWPGDAFKQRVATEPSSEFLNWVKAHQRGGVTVSNEREGKRLLLAAKAHPRKGKTARVLAQEFGITVRTVQRYTSIPRAEYEANAISRAKPWEALGMSRASWYRKGKPVENFKK